jgi:DNA-binding response OmpR family regulator
VTVLLVEDDSELRRMLRTFLEKCGYEIWEASDGTEAIRGLQSRLPDAIVLDAMLPGIHGFDICYRIKHAEGTRHIPVVMVSAVYRGWRYADDVRRLYGADHFLEKPLRLDELKHVLDQSVSAARSATVANADDLSAKAQASLREAAAAYRRGDLFGSARQLEEAVAASPFSSSLHQRLGMLYEQLDEPYRAIAEMGRAVELEPSYDKLLALARMYEKTGFTHKAFEAWERCLRLCQNEQDADRIRKHMERLLA